jgi:predicted Fe-Mo cluster-binding NifX family protein
MRLALATWNGRISPVFDVARQVLMLDVEDGRVLARREEPLPGSEPQAQAGRLAALGPRVLICGAVSEPMAAALAKARIRVIPFMAGNVEDIILAWQEGTLTAFLMPGCCGRMNRCRRGKEGWQNGQGWLNRKGETHENCDHRNGQGHVE